MSQSPDDYTTTLAAMRRAFDLSVGPATHDAIERAAVEQAVIVDWSVESAERNFKTLESLTSGGLRR